MSEEEMAFQMGEMMGQIVGIGLIVFAIYFICKKIFGKKDNQEK